MGKRGGGKLVAEVAKSSKTLKRQLESFWGKAGAGLKVSVHRVSRLAILGVAAERHMFTVLMICCRELPSFRLKGDCGSSSSLHGCL